MPGLGQVYISRKSSSIILENLPLTIYTSPLSVQALQSRSCLSYAAQVKIKSHYDWWSAGQSVWGPRSDFSTVGHLQIYRCGTPSLMREWVLSSVAVIVSSTCYLYLVLLIGILHSHLSSIQFLVVTYYFTVLYVTLVFIYVKYIYDLLSIYAWHSRLCCTSCYNGYLATCEQLHTWPLPSISLVYFRCWALPLPVSCTLAFSWFYITSACCMHSFVM
jgi:hypothetical protein